ncbi:G-protein coupled receptor family C group 6 member A [Leuresthes tenuis]|uniref:G-protein coupled receptor family C group 6 member A n=1 Tax=Leuresthes tenuis TaxID=355514 RepID=UPI003B5106BA
MTPFLSFCLFFSVFSHFFCVGCKGEARAPGDIIIGGLFPIHESVHRENENEPWTCNRLSPARLAQSLMMVYAVEEINKSGVLGNITLGYHIVDSCGDVTTALKNSQSFMSRLRNTNKDDSKQSSSPVLAVIGDYYSEISIAVTRQLNLENIPEISYGATSGRLSDKTRFPSFMRTVPEDDHQAQAIIEILKEHNWTWVGVVTTDGEYGRYAIERLRQHATKNNICFAFTSILPEFLVDNRIQDSIDSTVKSITENEKVQVIISFAKVYHMMYILDKVLRSRQGRGKVWLASDNWSLSTNVLNTKVWKLTDVGTVFGITLKSKNPAKFKQFLRSLDVNPKKHKNNSFLKDFLTDKKGEAIESLINMTYPYAVFSIELAVKAIAHAVTDLCINRKCDTSTLQPKEFRDALRNASFVMDNNTYSFDKNGDINSGYDVILWKETSPSMLDSNYVVGHYDIKNQMLTFEKKEDLYSLTKSVSSKCSESCIPGQRKKTFDGQPSCCYQCVSCPVNYFSNAIDATDCQPCNNMTEYSKEGDTNCTKKEVVFLKWRNPFNIVILVFTTLGALLTLIVGIIFIACWKTPVVRSSVGPISILLLFSLLSTFGSIILFSGKPNDLKCKAQHVLFALSFTLSVSCILVKSFKIILAFEFDPVTKSVLEKLYKPYLIIPTCMAGQVLICALWLAIIPPGQEWNNSGSTKRLHFCDTRSNHAFGVMLGYIGFLALLCLGIAFKGRKLPQSYNEAKFITFSMLIYSIAWIIFGPVYVKVTGENTGSEFTPAVEMVVILISAYGILFCQFLTKCYIILFKREVNTRNAFCQDVMNYSMGKDRVRCSDGIQNPALAMESLSNPESSDPLTNWKLSVNSTLTTLASSSALNPPPTALSSEKKQLQRYASLPASATNYLP